MRATVLTLVFALSGWAQSSSFEVASVKPHDSTGERRSMESIDSTPGNLMIRNTSLQACIKWAYDVKDYQISGPSWLTYDRYDISAKASGPARLPELRQMLETLLAYRFQLQIHRETKELPVYFLSVTKGGPKLHNSAPESHTGMHGENGSFVFSGTSMPQFAENLSTLTQVDRPVLDRTGIDGRFDFTLMFGDGPTDMKRALIAGDGPSIFTLIQEQLGLRLESGKAPVSVLVIEHAEKTPSAN